MFAEDLSAFLVDFGVPVTVNGGVITALFDKPGQDIMSSRVASEQYEITYIEADAPGLLFGAQVIVAGDSYTLLTTNTLDDGAFSRAVLERN